jgi:molybdopterin molybdotransferase
VRRAAEGNDLIITSGGVSVGEEDHIRRPSRRRVGWTSGRSRSSRASRWPSGRWPTAPAAAFFLGLPGNPVSSFVTFLLFVRPFILRLQGVADVTPRRLPLRADFDLPRGDAATNSCARASTTRRPRPVPEPEFGRADVHRVGRWPDRQSAEPDHPRGDVVQFIPFASLLA